MFAADLSGSGVNQFEHIVDRASKKYQMSSLAKIIREISGSNQSKAAYR